MAPLKFWTGFLLVVGGVIAGLYVGGWLCLIGGGAQIVMAATDSPAPPIDAASGALRMLFSGFFGVASALMFVLPGAELISSSNWE